jgi:hypothetical protein
MNLDYAVDRLYDIGWTASFDMELETLPDGRKCPTVLTIQREFSRAGLELSIKHNLMFDCYRATWRPVGEPLEPTHAADDKHGTVIGACEKEAAVYALAQLHASIFEAQPTKV